MHEQICVKTNCWVDKDIAPVVESLSLIPGLVTLESCQEWYPGESCVLFNCGVNLKEWVPLAELCSKMAEEIRKENIDYIHVSLEWLGTNDQPFGRLVAKPENVYEIVRAINRLASSVCLS